MNRALLLHDLEFPGYRWAHANRTAALAKYAPDDFAVDRMGVREIHEHDLRKYDLIYTCDYATIDYVAKGRDRSSPGTVLVASFNRDASTRHLHFERTCKMADWVVVNNRDRWEHGGRRRNTCWISNGVDHEFWWPGEVAEWEARPDNRILWTGSGNPAKGKGLEIVEAARGKLERLGFEIDARPIERFHPSDPNLQTPEQMLEWYQSGRFFLCTSESEATPNTGLEAMACGCAYVTTPVGIAHEIRNGSAVIIDRSPEGILEAFESEMTDHHAAGRFLGSMARAEILDHWTWQKRAEHFWALFRALCERGPTGVEPFAHTDIEPDAI